VHGDDACHFFNEASKNLEQGQTGERKGSEQPRCGETTLTGAAGYRQFMVVALFS
jgi:hypothetical protein